jgi:hypothetical protein
MEQAIFTSAETNRASGYHLVCRSSGIGEVEARELTAWAPSHDSLLVQAASARSINFFALASGAFCASRTVTAGQEYSERGGWRVLTKCLVVSAADLARFANNAFAVVRAALAAGAFDIPAALPQTLLPITLSGRSAKVDHTVLYRLASCIQADDLVRLITSIFERRQLIVATDIDPELLVAGIVNTLPLDRRLEFSFSTGLRHAKQRPFRLVVLPLSAIEELKHAAHAGVEVVSVKRESDLRADSEEVRTISAK